MQTSRQPLRGLGQTVAFFMLLAIQLALATSASAALQPGVYQTIMGSLAEERGDRVTNEVRIVPITATVTITLGAQPSMTAVIQNAVLEGGAPFPLTVTNSYEPYNYPHPTPDGGWNFRGEYIPGSGYYFFDWTFTPASNGNVLWNGTAGFAGGHIWQLTFADVTLVPEPSGFALVGIGLIALTLSRRHFGQTRRAAVL